MAEDMAFLLFGDQSLNAYECLAAFFRRTNLGILSKCFLEQTSTALQNEIDRLSSVDRQRIPTFSSIQELNERYHVSTTKNSAVDSALLSITQLTHYIE
jgi:Starter unit:ACP transacylase in aflatoxin biosynthesis